MTQLTSQISQPLALPKVPIAVRVATMCDLPFIDALQKKQSKAVGWMPTKQLEGKIAKGEVLVADGTVDSSELRVDRSGEASSLSTNNHQLSTTPVGYLIGCDRYFKRDDVGIIYAINVVPEHQRSLVAATLLKAQFERSAYGTRLYSCWCAQDLAANRFWESMGFVPLAFRAGSRAKGKGGAARVHIFWQKRIRSGDTGDASRGGTPWWYPSLTSGGSIREDRIVLPILPGVHWSEARAVVLPTDVGSGELGARRVGLDPPALPAARAGGSRPTLRKNVHRSGGIFFAPAATAVVAATAIAAVKVKPQTAPRRKAKHDPVLVARARELRDRWLEQVNAGGGAVARGKYDVTRAIEGSPMLNASHVKRVDAVAVKAATAFPLLLPAMRAA